MDEEREENTQDGVGKFNVSGFSRDVTIYSAGQALLLVIGAIQGLLIPKFLSVADYGYYQAFLLYANYVALLHLGFIDGAFVRWAKKGEDLVEAELKPSLVYIAIQLLAVILPLSIICILLLKSQNQIIFLSVLIYGFISNIVLLFTAALLAARKFKSSTVVNIAKALLVFGVIVGIFLTGNNQFYNVIMAVIGGQLILGIIMLYLFRRYLKGTFKPDTALQHAKANLRIGIYVLSGNFIITLFMTVDRLAVNTLFSVEQFAVYSFAMTIILVAYLFISAIGQVLFPYLTRVKHELRADVYRLGKPSIILMWCGILAFYYPMVWLINRFFPQYVACIPVLAVLLCSVSFGGIIQILHVNYYMSYFKQRQYFFTAVTVLVIFISLLASALIFYKTLLSIAFATLISLGIWYIGNELYLNSILKFSYRSLMKDLVFIVFVSSAFLISSFLTIPPISQFFIYLAAATVSVFIFLHHELMELLALASSILKAHK
ncbi:MAG: oligosaccharide flippase family protein [Dehalococcoidia bacterium]|jgi:O-antigen/teichoic acid export membrane protein